MLTTDWKDEIEVVKEGKETVKEGFEDKVVTVDNIEVDPVEVVKLKILLKSEKKKMLPQGKYYH